MTTPKHDRITNLTGAQAFEARAIHAALAPHLQQRVKVTATTVVFDDPTVLELFQALTLKHLEELAFAKQRAPLTTPDGYRTTLAPAGSGVTKSDFAGRIVAAHSVKRKVARAREAADSWLPPAIGDHLAWLPRARS